MRCVYISSNAFPRKDFDSIFQECKRLGIQYLELGSSVPYDPIARKKIISASREIKILLHNYIPAPRNPFVLNLASVNKGDLKKSRQLAKAVLEISSEIQAPFYSIHSGFAYHAQSEFLGRQQIQLKHFSLTEARKIFIESIGFLSTVAKKLGVKLLVENNVVTPVNLIAGENKSFLLADLEDSALLLKTFNEMNVHLLLDMGHLKVSAMSLKFDKLDYINYCQPYIDAFHISENDGYADQHLPAKKDSWFLKVLADFPETSVILEINDNLAKTIDGLKLFNK